MYTYTIYKINKNACVSPWALVGRALMGFPGASEDLPRSIPSAPRHSRGRPEDHTSTPGKQWRTSRRPLEGPLRSSSSTCSKSALESPQKWNIKMDKIGYSIN